MTGAKSQRSQTHTTCKIRRTKQYKCSVRIQSQEVFFHTILHTLQYTHIIQLTVFSTLFHTLYIILCTLFHTTNSILHIILCTTKYSAYYSTIPSVFSRLFCTPYCIFILFYF